MKYITAASLTPAEAVERLTAALGERGFGVLHIHNLKETLISKGVPFETECQVLDVCNPQQAAKVLTNDIDLNMALPCRISVYEKNGRTHIGMLRPTQLVRGLSDSPALKEIADEVESVLMAAIAETAS